jgi:hypothetical protein
MEALIAILVVLVVASMAAGTWAFFFLMAKLDDTKNRGDRAASKMNSSIGMFAKDLDSKFSYYAHDPTGVLAISDDGSLAEAKIQGNASSQLTLGRGNITFDDSSDRMSFGTKKGSAKIGLQGDKVSVDAAQLRIGGVTFSTLADNSMKICQAGVGTNATETCTVCSLVTGECVESS